MHALGPLAQTFVQRRQQRFVRAVYAEPHRESKMSFGRNGLAEVGKWRSRAFWDSLLTRYSYMQPSSSFRSQRWLSPSWDGSPPGGNTTLSLSHSSRSRAQCSHSL